MTLRNAPSARSYRLSRDKMVLYNTLDLSLSNVHSLLQNFFPAAREKKTAVQTYCYSPQSLFNKILYSDARLHIFGLFSPPLRRPAPLRSPPPGCNVGEPWPSATPRSMRSLHREHKPDISTSLLNPTTPQHAPKSVLSSTFSPTSTSVLPPMVSGDFAKPGSLLKYEPFRHCR